jgi:hypothetical protein
MLLLVELIIEIQARQREIVGIFICAVTSCLPAGGCRRHDKQIKRAKINFVWNTAFMQSDN